jgi:aminoglycoside phosphotransferase (APT) family kinase protein
MSTWLRTVLQARDHVEIGPISSPGGSGVANETLLFDADWRDANGQPCAGGFALRIGSATPLYFEGDIHRQYRMYEALAGTPGVPIPRVYGFEHDPSLIGAPFFVAERIAGQIPPDRPHYTEGGFVFEATPGERRRLWTDAVEVLARLHQAPPERVAFLDRPTRGSSGLEQELSYFRDYLDWACPGRPHALLETGYEWLRANVPPGAPKALSWGDSRIGNMIWRDFRCVAVLDWDGVSLAGPEADLAWWILMDHPSSQILPGIGTPDELVDLWESLTGRTARPLHYYLVFTAFRLGVILQRLFSQMAENGQLEATEAARQAANGRALQHLALLLGVPPLGPVTVTLPRLRR